MAMGLRIDTERLIHDIVRLRKAELIGAPGLASPSIREGLEAMVGPTIGRATSARVLGITQTALDRYHLTGLHPGGHYPVQGAKKSLSLNWSDSPWIWPR